MAGGGHRLPHRAGRSGGHDRPGWGQDIHNFYTLDGAVALCEKLKYFDKGRVVLNIAELPFKCPVAPLEFVFMADWFFTINGVRDHVEIELVTPLPGAFTKPKAAEILGQICDAEKHQGHPQFQLAEVDVGEKDSSSPIRARRSPTIFWSPSRRTSGPNVIIDSEMGDPMGYVETDNFTLEGQKIRPYLRGGRRRQRAHLQGGGRGPL